MNQYDRKQREAQERREQIEARRHRNLFFTCTKCEIEKRKIEFPRWSKVCHECGGGDLKPKPGPVFTRRGRYFVPEPKVEPEPSGRKAKPRRRNDSPARDLPRVES